ncbi:MAG: hypothetical protein HY675_19265 [Chloroflexi bacterium]|nr:hypothetical protein [Chloroflexota bacterium]
MPRTITIDNIKVTEVRLNKDSSGQLRIYAEYQLKSGTQVVQAKYEEITAGLSSQRRTSAAALLDAIVQDLTAAQA